jgi:hypothetical protein
MLLLAILIIPFRWLFAWIFAILIHELSHIALILLFRTEIHSIDFQTSGTYISAAPMTGWKMSLCASAGPASGLLLLLTVRYMPRVALCAALHSVYNLLPIFPLDGGRVLWGLAESIWNEEKANSLCCIAGIICKMCLAFAVITAAVYFKNIRDFKLELSKYLKEQNLKYDLENDPYVIDAFKDFMLKSADDVMLRPGILHLNAKRRMTDTAIHFVTFNYTDALDRICSKLAQDNRILESFPHPVASIQTRLGNIYHVHGTLDSSLIMGVDNYEQLNSSMITNFSKLSRTLIKPIVNDELGREDHENAISILNDGNYLFFYGLSFGVTDQTWWNLISDHIIRHANCQAVIFTRSSDDDIQPIIPEDVLDYVNDKKDEFLAKIGIEPGSDYYDTVRKRVFVIRNTKRLNISIKDRKIPANV